MEKTKFLDLNKPGYEHLADIAVLNENFQKIDDDASKRQKELEDHKIKKVSASEDGHMTKEDKKKIDGIAPGANNYTLPVATESVLGGVKSDGNTTQISGLGIISLKDAWRLRRRPIGTSSTVTDMDTILEKGFYESSSSGNKWTNGPLSDGAFFLEVKGIGGDATYGTQTWYSITQNRIFHRVNATYAPNPPKWTAWSELATVAETVKKTQIATNTTTGIVKGGQFLQIGSFGEINLLRAKGLTDANILKLEGRYTLKGDACINLPDNFSWFQLDVKTVNDDHSYCVQIAQSLANKIAIRSCQNNVWSSWIWLATVAEVNGKYDIRKKPGVLDLNTMKTDGIFSGYQWTNSPAGSPIATVTVEVYSADWLVQKFYDIASGYQWQRRWYNGNTWGQWEEIATTSKTSQNKPQIGECRFFDDQNINPANIWKGAVFSRIAINRNIRGANIGEAVGTIGGSDTAVIAQGNLPNINLLAQEHTHTRGGMNITGNVWSPTGTGAFYDTGRTDTSCDYSSGGRFNNIRFDASRAWTGATSGASARNVPLGGSNTPLNVTNAYYKLHVWKRIS